MERLKSILLREQKSLLSVCLCVVAFLVFSPQANAVTTSSFNYGNNANSCSSDSKSISVAPDSEIRFLVDGIFSHKFTEWYVNGGYIEYDESKLTNGYRDPEYTITFSGCTGSYTITAEVYNEASDGSWDWLCRYAWIVTINGDCSSGDCCDDCYYKSYNSQPIGKEDFYFCEGNSSATGTSYVKKRDYKCTGSSSSSINTSNTVDICGTCKYCTSFDSTCNNYSSSTVCDSNADVEFDCDGSACGADVIKRYRDKYCSGSSCGSYGSWKNWQTADNCSSSEVCTAGDSSCNSAQSHASYQCANGDVYYYDACGSKEDKKTDCGSSGLSGNNYCCGNNVCRDYITRGCSGNSCTENTTEQTQEDCDFGCSDGTCDGQCTSGLCCNVSTKKFQPDTFICNEELEEGFRCETEDCGADAQSQLKVQYCSGDSKACNGEEKWLDWETLEACDNDDACNSGEGFAECVGCPEGCGDDDTGECNKPDCTEGECCDVANSDYATIFLQKGNGHVISE